MTTPVPNPLVSAMTLRDHFAGLVMHAALTTNPSAGSNPKTLARVTYDIADAMLAGRVKA